MNTLVSINKLYTSIFGYKPSPVSIWTGDNYQTWKKHLDII